MVPPRRHGEGGGGRRQGGGAWGAGGALPPGALRWRCLLGRCAGAAFWRRWLWHGALLERWGESAGWLAGWPRPLGEGATWLQGQEGQELRRTPLPPPALPPSCRPSQMVPRDWFRGGLLADIKYYSPFSTKPEEAAA